jgi:hypothetical protein
MCRVYQKDKRILKLDKSLAHGILKHAKEHYEEDLSMKKQGVILFLAIVLLTPSISLSAPFSIVGPRALGMGGASVAAVNDATAAYWNPAALAYKAKVDIRIPASLSVKDHIGLEDKWNRINEIYDMVQAWDPAAINEMITLLNDLNKPDTGVDLDMTTGLFIGIPFAKSAIAVSVLGLADGSMFPTIDTQRLDPNPLSSNFVGNNQSSVTGIGIATYQPTLSLATSFMDKIFVGVNAKQITADTYTATVLLTQNDFENFSDNFDSSKTNSSSAAVDAGILFAPVESFRIGVVGRDLNSPAFESIIGDIEFEPQVRAGFAWNPYSTLTIAADYDVTKNKSLTPGYESQVAAIGLEQTLLAEYFNLRLGLNKNLADDDAKTIYTGGIGLRLFALRINVAGGYDFDERQAEVSADLALRF